MGNRKFVAVNPFRTSDDRNSHHMKIVGVMSGTSYDAIDVAAGELWAEGDTLWLTPLGALDVPYDPAIQDAITTALPPRQVTAEHICRLDAILGQAFAAAADQAVKQLCGGTADLVVCHGQTVFHWIDGGVAGGTLQLGRAAWIAERTAIPVISDLRSADIAHGGQGAPLVPIFDALLLDPTPVPRAALNLGGIANLTVVRAGEAPIGYDVGPGNALIDAAMAELFGKPYDAGGVRAAAGQVHRGLLAALLAEPYYAAAPPKSTGKELFNRHYLAERIDSLGEPVPPEDVVATVTELTARVVAAECERHDVVEVLASGGGVHNPVLMDRLARLAGDRRTVRGIDALGVPADAKEAYAFAVLGWLTWHGLPGTVPSVTGARRPALLGSITPGRDPLRLPPPLDGAPRRLRVAARRTRPGDGHAMSRSGV
jgi:anhydro-N-acetylmuramic acid kinase